MDLFYFFKLSAARREDFLKIQQKLDMDEVVFLRHVESRWLSQLPAAERVKDQFPSLLEYFKQLPEADKKIKENERYRMIMSFLTSPETMVQLYFLESFKPVFDQFLQLFQTEGPLIHILLQLLKQVMFRFLKQSVVQGKTVHELPKVDSKNVHHQLKDEDLEIGVGTRKAINELKHSRKQRHCYLGIRLFFTSVISYMQKLLELNNSLVEALGCLHPDERDKEASIQKIKRVVGNSFQCVKTEELTLLTGEWQMYAEMNIPQDWLQQKDGKTARVDHYWNKIL